MRPQTQSPQALPNRRRQTLLTLTVLGLLTTGLCPRPIWGQTSGQSSSSATLSPPAVTAPLTNPDNPEQPAYEFRGGRWIPIPKVAPTTIPTDETLDRAEEYLQRQGWRAARKLLLRWFDTHDRKAPLRDRATFLFAEVYFQSGNRVLSFYHFDEVMDLYPESRLYPAALQRQYDIADAYLQGYKARFLYLPVLGMEDEAIEMLFRIQNRAPGSPIAEKALLRTADFYYATSQFDLAADAYGAYVKSYPRSPLVARVRLRQAFSQMAQFRGVRFDASPALDARESLSDLIITQPELASQEALPAVVKRIDDSLARKLLETADFYRRTNQERGAVYLYRLLVKSYPENPDAETARGWLARIPERFQQDPEPSTRRGNQEADDLALPPDKVPPLGPDRRENRRPATTVPATPEGSR